MQSNKQNVSDLVKYPSSQVNLIFPVYFLFFFHFLFMLTLCLDMQMFDPSWDNSKTIR